MSQEERDQKSRMLAAVKDELQTEFEKVPAQISHAYFKLTRDYLLLLCDLREMIELGYPIRLINDRAAQQSCSSKVPKVQKAPSQKPCREQDGPSSALNSIYMTAEEYHYFLQWQKEKKAKKTTMKDMASGAAKTAANKVFCTSTSEEQKPADAASGEEKPFMVPTSSMHSCWELWEREEEKPFKASGLDGKMRWYKNREEYAADHGTNPFYC